MWICPFKTLFRKKQAPYPARIIFKNNKTLSKIKKDSKKYQQKQIYYKISSNLLPSPPQ